MLADARKMIDEIKDGLTVKNWHFLISFPSNDAVDIYVTKNAKFRIDGKGYHYFNKTVGGLVPATRSFLVQMGTWNVLDSSTYQTKLNTESIENLITETRSLHKLISDELTFVPGSEYLRNVQDHFEYLSRT